MDGNSQFPSLGSIRLDVPTPTNENVMSLYCSVHYIVLISVDHGDLPDGGSGHFAETVRAMKKGKPEIMAERLTSDFQGDLEAVSMLANSGLEIFAHNIDTVNASREIYEQSLSVLKHAKLSKEGMITKTSIMLGLGETDDELKEAMAHLRVHVQCMYLEKRLNTDPELQLDVFRDVVFELKWLHFCGGKSMNTRLIIRAEKSIADNIVVVLNEVTEAMTTVLLSGWCSSQKRAGGAMHLEVFVGILKWP
ncbi:plastid lipoate synthase 1 (chloroplast) [Artemisia annua]|uniref:Plastid lipoate synthase 1 n=1 Tax=Artemisia annua TaxID=35608 RepID=A0A2U1NRE8_ARTAN|nr:plastid lipoate synthase 1 [Artemisia annua]